MTARTIAMMNQKGGVGKTTSTVNLGAALAQCGQRVCMIDLDPQAHLTLHLGIDADADRASVYDLLLDPACPADEAIVNARENLDVIPAEVDLAAAESELAGRDDRNAILRGKLEPLGSRYDCILLDCPPSLGLLTINALVAADEVFVPMQPHFLALQGVGKLLETVGRVCQTVNTDLRVTGIIVCMHEGQTTLAREVVGDLDQFFEQARDQDVPWRDCRVLRPPIRRNIKLAEAPSFGQTIFDYSPWCPGAIDYRTLAEHLVAEWSGASAKPKGKATTHAEDRASAEPTTAPSNDRDAESDDDDARDAMTVEIRTRSIDPPASAAPAGHPGTPKADDAPARDTTDTDDRR